MKRIISLIIFSVVWLAVSGQIKYRPHPVMLPCDSSVFIPTAFTPNGDGVNDCFNIKFTKDTPVVYELSIFNRKGIEVFYTQKYDECWTGEIEDTLGVSEFSKMLKDLEQHQGKCVNEYHVKYAPEDEYLWILKYRYPKELEIRECKGGVLFLK